MYYKSYVTNNNKTGLKKLLRNCDNGAHSCVRCFALAVVQSETRGKSAHLWCLVCTEIQIFFGGLGGTFETKSGLLIQERLGVIAAAASC